MRLIYVLMMLLAGCGGSGGNGSTAPPTAPPAPIVLNPTPVVAKSSALAMMAAAKGFNVQVPKVSFATAATNPITADPATTNTLQVYKLGVGEVRSDPPGINCGEACKTALSKLTSVTLTAIAPTSYNFTGWQGDCAGNAPTCTLSMNMPHIVTATFTSIPTLDGKMDCVLNWAEKTFPKDYYPASVSRVINGYYARHYTTPDVWLAMKFSDSHVYFVDAAGYMYDYGSIVLYLEQAGC